MMLESKMLKGDSRRRDVSVFDRWIAETAKLCSEFWHWSEMFFPFHDNETSAVSILLAGAARANYLPISEYNLRKRGKTDKRERRDGRADLWFLHEQRAYSFEFKRAWSAATLSNLDRAMNAALADMQCVQSDEYDHAYGGLIAPVYDHAEEGCYEAFVKQVDLAFVLGSKDTFLVYLFFSRCE